MRNEQHQEEPHKTGESLTLTEASELHYLHPKTLRFFRHGAVLRLIIEDEMCCLQVSIVRLFPLSDPQQYLSVRSGDNKEIGIITDAAQMDADSRALVAEELMRRYVVPAIRRVISVKERFGTVDWTVETDRGTRTFTTRNLRENVAQPSPNRYLMSDVDGNRYDVHDITTLDAASQSFLLRYV